MGLYTGEGRIQIDSHEESRSARGHPLIEYVIEAGKASYDINRIICSTENSKIAKFCKSKDIEIHRRPKWLAGDRTPVLKVLQHTLKDLWKRDGYLADMIVLLQPTSPFVLPRHIEKLVSLLRKNPTAQSAQTISHIPHNFHAFNQRMIRDGWVKFRFENERKRFYNKQKKPTFYRFGNLVVCRTRTVLKYNTIFGDKSIPLEIPERYAMDVDGPKDLEMANLILEKRLISTPYFSIEKKKR